MIAATRAVITTATTITTAIAAVLELVDDDPLDVVGVVAGRRVRTIAERLVTRCPRLPRADGMPQPISSRP